MSVKSHQRSFSDIDVGQPLRFLCIRTFLSNMENWAVSPRQSSSFFVKGWENGFVVCRKLNLRSLQLSPLQPEQQSVADTVTVLKHQTVHYTPVNLSLSRFVRSYCHALSIPERRLQWNKQWQIVRLKVVLLRSGVNCKYSRSRIWLNADIMIVPVPAAWNMIRSTIIIINVKKLQFIHMLTATCSE